VNQQQTAKIDELLTTARELARQYRELTGKPLGITGEVAEFEAARLLGLQLVPARQDGYDATETVCSITRRLQIKGRCLAPGANRGQRIGTIQSDKPWDAVLLVLLDLEYRVTAIWEADRESVLTALAVPGSKARNERGALSIAKFKQIGKVRWAFNASVSLHA
jgi:hypothetical protein